MYGQYFTVLNSSEHRQCIAAVIREREIAFTEITDRGLSAPKTPRIFEKSVKENHKNA